MVDKRLFEVEPLPNFILKDIGLQWFAEGDNDEYISEEWIKLTPQELEQFKRASADLYQTAIDAAKYVVERELWQEIGIPKEAIEVVSYSLENELDYHLIGRYDFAGGIDNIPIKLLEFNADTCSLMPETSKLQKEQWLYNTFKKHGRPYNELHEGLVERLRYILAKNKEKHPSLLVITMGHDDDVFNAEIVAEAAKEAGFAEVQSALLEDVIFSPEEGIFIEYAKEKYKRFDFCFKFIPWEFIAYEEPELLDILSAIICDEIAIVLNPAFTMLLQSKALMKVMYDISRYNQYLLQTSFSSQQLAKKEHVEKPIFGRMGESIVFHHGDGTTYETEGDYGHFPKIYQEVAAFNIDKEDHRYQPSIFWTGDSAALCLRRQDDPIIDDDAEFVGHIIPDPV